MQSSKAVFTESYLRTGIPLEKGLGILSHDMKTRCGSAVAFCSWEWKGYMANSHLKLPIFKPL